MGVRHHGPGSARAVLAALRATEPAVLLVEGPPEADPVLHLAGDARMRPPVALLAHAGGDEPGRAAFWPLAAFSPEWVALRWAVERGVPVRFIDLPAAHSLAMSDDPAGESATPAGPGPEEPGLEEPGQEGPRPEASEQEAPRQEATRGRAVRIDPLAVLAETAGHDDPERWWEDVVEHRGTTDGPVGEGATGAAAGTAAAAGALGAFRALEEAMTALRQVHSPAPGAAAAPGAPETGDSRDHRDDVREAHMRLRLREAVREFGADRVAVVCGAWHVPALRERRAVTADRQLLKGLPKVRAEISWVPWTHRRLSRHSGYGAGIESPGWYGHLFTAADRPVTRWMTKVAALLREEDLPVSSAHVIEAVRLAEALAAMRGRPLAGLSETSDAVRAVLCEGSDVPYELIRDRLIVGDVLGEVPPDAPAVPLQRDLDRLHRSLRLKPEAHERTLELDLRNSTDAARSRLLHRLRLLGVEWGEPVRARGGTGTFRESWSLRWQPELSVRIAEAGVWGTTVEGAATARAEALATEAGALADVTALAERCLLAGLGDALPVVMRVLADRAALDADVGHLAQALPALVRSARYGDVRGTDAVALREVAEGLAERVCVGLPPACAGLDADGAAAMRGDLDAAHQAVGLLDTEGLSARWRAMLGSLTRRDRVPGLLRGRATRLLLDAGDLPEQDAARVMGLALSPAAPPQEAASWVEGFLSGGGMLLVHDERLLSLVDTWLADIPQDVFTDVLPLLRRTFSVFEAGVRRTVGELVRRGTGVRGGPPAPAAATGFDAALDAARADAVLPTLRLLLGRLPEPPGAPTRGATSPPGAATSPGTHTSPGTRTPPLPPPSSEPHPITAGALR
ncbi:DUF5682 family protein [Streptomyces sp. 549]|uniref:DUF5682 family protein n=1 Tax=Streptomyces sp. 549 TaxID=3049076 RepID=UPI0024C40F34|nr:DUF5682 family protein [Streptomyces sp. 549]MDK1472786.1 DUF5682 family protein [Streptomyces sp. 549]